MLFSTFYAAEAASCCCCGINDIYLDLFSELQFNFVIRCNLIELQIWRVHKITAFTVCAPTYKHLCIFIYGKLMKMLMLLICFCRQHITVQQQHSLKALMGGLSVVCQSFCLLIAILKYLTVVFHSKLEWKIPNVVEWIWIGSKGWHINEFFVW